MRVRTVFGTAGIKLMPFKTASETSLMLGEVLAETGCQPREGSFELHSWKTVLGETLALNLANLIVYQGGAIQPPHCGYA